jgi:predicted DNA-binding transcriptional regulator YafY
MTKTAARVGGYMERLEFDYVNYKGEKSHRQVIVHSINYGISKWHTKPQWLMYALDIDKNEFRDFAMKDMLNVRDELLAAPETK